MTEKVISKQLQKRPQTSRPRFCPNIHHGHTKDSNDMTFKPFLEGNHNESNSLSSQTDNNINTNNNNNNNFDMIESVITDKQKANYEMLIQEEADRITQINLKKDQLDDLELIEKNIGDLYDWKTLFNNSRPLSSYTKLSMPNKLNKDEGEMNDSFKFPLALIDTTEDKVAQFIPNLMIEQPPIRPNQKNKTNDNNNNHDNTTTGEVGLKPRIGNATRPQSIYSKRNKNDSFHLSKAFSDYYNEDLKSFCKKIPLLEAKIHVDHKKFNDTVKNIKKKITEKELIFGQEMNKEEDIYLSPRLLKFAGAKNLCEPLLKSIYHQIHPKNDTNYNTNNTNTIQRRSTKSIQNEEINQILINSHQFQQHQIYNQNNHSSMKSLFLPTYDENDPQLQIFNQILEGENNQSNNHSHSQSQTQSLKQDKSENITEEQIIIKSKQPQSQIRPLTGIPPSSQIKRIFSAAPTKQQKILSSRPQSSIPYQTPLTNKYQLNSSASLNNLNTRPTTAILNYIPAKRMPFRRTASAINNKLYQRIDNNIKNKIKKNLNNDCFGDDYKAPTAIAYNDDKNEVSCLKSTMGLNLIVVPPLEMIQSFNFPPTRNGTQLNNEHQSQHQQQFTQNYISYVNFNDYIDTKIISLKEESKKGTLIGKYHKNAHEINYYNTHYFNKGTAAKSFNAIKRSKNLSRSNSNKKRKMSWRHSNNKYLKNASNV